MSMNTQGVAVAGRGRYGGAMSALPLPAQGDDLFRLLVEQVKDYAIFGLDPNGIVISWNAGAENIKGYQAHEIIGHHFSRFYPPDAIRAGWPKTELELATRDGRFEDEGWRVRKDGTRFWANVVITALRDPDGTLRGFAKVTRDLTDRRRIERLEADAQQMGEFVAMLAHELRNPLAPIRSAISVVRHSDGDATRLSWALDVIDRQAGHLTRLVDDLLDVGRITRGQVRLERRRVRLGGIVDAAVEAVQPLVQQRGHALTVHVEANPLVRGDAVRLTQVFTNLLTNACKYTPPGGRIDVRLDQVANAGRMTVSDNGSGIAPDMLPRVFDIFTQDKRGLDRAEGGLGLGLTITRRLVELHGGSVQAHSAGPGCGSEFTVSLPALPTHAGDEDALTVLVIDDNVDAASTMQALVELNGHRCVVANAGEAGLALAREAVPDIVLLDIGLPGMNGYEVARRLRGIPLLDGVLLVAVTGYATEEDRQQALDAGFDVHLSKPVSYEQLVQRLPMLGPTPKGEAPATG
jgi:PAS domain S-box-containing protein